MQHKWGMGMRTLKTAFAIWLAFLVCDLLKYPNGALAAITTIVAIQPSLKGSLTTIKNQLVATTFGSSQHSTYIGLLLAFKNRIAVIR
ncbi:MAG: hypothetical protein IIU56_05310 [Peptococcaceae bacterium]|nr:hypothetical protein [Peptococcaceae bacterium]